MAVLIVVAYALKRAFKSELVQGFLGKYKKIEIGKGGLKLEHKDGDSEKDSVLNAIKDELREIRKRLDTHYTYIREAVVQSGIGIVWSYKAPFKEAIWAALNNIKLGENGNLITRTVEIIMEAGKNGVTDYRSELNKFIKENFTRPGKEIPEHFTKTIEAIDREIH